MPTVTRHTPLRCVNINFKSSTKRWYSRERIKVVFSRNEKQQRGSDPLRDNVILRSESYSYLYLRESQVVLIKERDHNCRARVRGRAQSIKWRARSRREMERASPCPPRPSL